MRICVEKFIVKQGHYEENFVYIEKAIKQAKQNDYEMIILQSNCITGVFVGENLIMHAEEIFSYNKKIRDLAKDIYVVWGNFDEDYSQSMYVAKDDLFVKVEKAPRQDRFYNEQYEVENLFAEIDERFVIGFGKYTISEKFHILFDIQEETTKNLNIANGVYINHFGVESINKSVVVFNGEVQCFKNKKAMLIEKSLEEKTIALDTEVFTTYNLFDLLVFALRIFDEQVFAKKFNWVVGLSGGIDSTISASLLTYAFGKERVIGYNMATKNNTNQTISIAQNLAKSLGIKYHDGIIAPLVDATYDILHSYGYDVVSDLAKQNVQARIRGHLLSSFASIENALIVNNGNKVETAFGYATLYGDMVGAISPLADLTKVQLFTLAEEINSAFKKEVIPNALIPSFENGVLNWQQKPSAELAEGQFDPMKWFYHDYLVDNLNKTFTVTDFMKQYLDKTIDSEIYQWMKFYGLDDPTKFIEDLDWVVTTMERNKFKLLQSPPIISVSERSFGSDIPVIQAKFDNKKYNEYKKQILAK